MANLPEIKVLGVSGSLRRGSYNTAALREAIGLAPAGMHIEMGTSPRSRSTTKMFSLSVFPRRSSVFASRSERPMPCCGPHRNTTTRFLVC